MSATARLELRDVERRFGRRQVLDGVSLTIGPGELVGVTGENGAGKTTLMRIAAGHLRPGRGTVRRAGRLGYCPQEPLVFERLTVAENAAWFASAYGLSRWREEMDALMVRYRFERWEQTLVRELSAGTRQKVNLALALLHHPDLLLLDEPYAGFDWETYGLFWEHADALRSAGCGVLVISHLIHDRSRFDRLCEMREGRLTC